MDLSEDYVGKKLAERLMSPTSINEDIHELLAHSMEWTDYVKEINALLVEGHRDNPLVKLDAHGRNNGNYKIKNIKERAKVFHKNCYIGIIIRASSI